VNIVLKDSLIMTRTPGKQTF